MSESCTSAVIPAVDISSNAGAEAAAIVLIAGSCVLGLAFAFWQYMLIKKIDLTLDVAAEEQLVQHDDAGAQGESRQEKLQTISAAIQAGAKSFLNAEYKICAAFLVVFGVLVLVLLGTADNCGNVPISGDIPEGSCWTDAGFTLLAFVIGGATSMLCGYIGMMIAVYTNVRTTVEATRGWTKAFNAAFRGGAVMGFALSSLALLVLFIVIMLFQIKFVDADRKDSEFVYFILFEVVAGYGLGGSCIALFGRVGGGIYTKAADVGADLVGKVEKDIPEDDPRNPATIADNVGDNVGDIAGMGADLFGSFAESTSAALVLSANSIELQRSFATMLFPLTVSAMGILCCILTSFLATNISPVKAGKDVEKVLKVQLIASTVLLTPVLLLISWLFIPNKFTFGSNPCQNDLPSTADVSTWWGVFICLASGLWAGLFTGLITEYYTSHSYAPVREVAKSSETGAATLIIYGLALGYKSAIIPVFLLGITVFASFYLVGLYGVAMAALGMLSSFSIGLTIDAYGPITDNAGGIAEMSELGEDVRNITDTLDAAGNTTAAIGKGFAIGSAALVSLALFGAYTTRVSNVVGVDPTVNILQPIVFAFLLIGAMIPYWFSAMTMKSVGIAAQAMVKEVRDQFATIEGIMEGTGRPNYERCVEISTKASLREMIAPSVLIIFSPILTGYLFGIHALSGLLAGSLVSSVQLALSASNTGGAWDNAKKYIESGELGGKGSECHKAAVVGDTVGDPLKDTSGPALNIVMKLMAIISLVFANSFANFAAPKGSRWAGYA
ncbi:Pyrophosphate-energized vacuolar membrane proton pump (Pyrophosphate-energized inorganic pyrophosphatase) (H(+)-PPase) (Vacuolar H(+)-pyrophosphatase) [Durusdinium trenchii]|uniref:H(+)-exporting diphosphatase n=1 Tax=Durusdinium trenchii TaxID=1381693 RepID=A0ABP0QLT6_9DINO